MPQTSVSCLIANFNSRFYKARVDSPRLCAELILCEILGLTRAQLIAFPERQVSDAMASQCEALAVRREQGEPMAYILGRKEFYGLDFIVNPAVLVPRPETELIVDLLKQKFSQTVNYCTRPSSSGFTSPGLTSDPASPSPASPGPVSSGAASSAFNFADLGTGSGCLLTTILLTHPSWRGVGVDISSPALEVAQKNILTHGVEKRCQLIQADFTNLPLGKQSLQLIVSNPPYIPTSQYNALSPEVRCFEPELALHSGLDGLDHPRKIIKTAEYCLASGGLLLMEIGEEQGEAVLALLSLKHWIEPQIIKDLAGRNRVAMAYKN